MPAYTPLKNKPNTLRFSLPSTPECEVWGPGRLSWGMRTRINSKALRIEGGPDGESSAMDLSLLQHEMVQQWLCGGKGGWNLAYENGDAMPLNPSTIDNELDADDVAFIAMKLLQSFYPEMFGETPGAEGETPAPETEPEAKTKKPKNS